MQMNFFLSPQDHDFFQHLEMHMRSEFPPLCGRDHLSFRSYYFPVKVGTCTGKTVSVSQSSVNKCWNFLVGLNDRVQLFWASSGYINIK